MDIAEFDRLPVADADALVRACADIDEWVETVVGGRPYGSVDELLAIAGKAALEWTPSEVGQALTDHPRIGEKHGGSGTSAKLSSGEQAGVGDSTKAAIAEGNRAYEDRFDHIFLIRAAGRDGEEILAELTRRLDNDPESELAETTRELQQIAALRLEGLFA